MNKEDFKDNGRYDANALFTHYLLKLMVAHWIEWLSHWVYASLHKNGHKIPSNSEFLQIICLICIVFSKSACLMRFTGSINISQSNSKYFWRLSTVLKCIRNFSIKLYISNDFYNTFISNTIINTINAFSQNGFIQK